MCLSLSYLIHCFPFLSFLCLSFFLSVAFLVCFLNIPLRAHVIPPPPPPPPPPSCCCKPKRKRKRWSPKASDVSQSCDHERWKFDSPIAAHGISININNNNNNFVSWNWKEKKKKKKRNKRNKRKLVKRKKTLLIWWCPISRSISVYKIEIENAIIITISFVVSDCVCVIQRKRRDSGSLDAWRRNCCREKTDDPCSEQREQRLPPSLPPSSLFRARC